MNWPRVVHLELVVTEGCNMSCAYCFESGRNARSVMSLNTAKLAVDFALRESADAPCLALALIGGEPLLELQLIRRIVEYSRTSCRDIGKRLELSLTTNGLLLDAEILQFLSEVELTYIVSIDGLTNSVLAPRGRHAALVSERVRELMPTMKALQPWQGARITVLPETCAFLRDSVEELHRVGFNQFVIGFATGVHWTNDDAARLAAALLELFAYYSLARERGNLRRIRIPLFEGLGSPSRARVGWGCGAGSGRIAVVPSGVVHGCSKLAWGPRGTIDAALPLGTIVTGFARPDNRRVLLNGHSRPRLKCKACEIRNRCSGGCYAANFTETGDPLEPSASFCRLSFAVVTALDEIA